MERTDQQHFFSSHADKQEGWELSWGCQLCQHSGKLSILPWLCLCQLGMCTSLGSSALDLLHGFLNISGAAQRPRPAASMDIKSQHILKEDEHQCP